MAGERNFIEINVGNFHGQKGSQRVLNVEDQAVPRMAHWRNNLTALSHDFNLYFTAYRDKIHITRPLGLHQTLPITPDLILDLPRSAEGVNAGGYIDELRPHNVNSIKIGTLGNFEILLIGCDDGDVIAYYTRLLDRETEATGSNCSESDGPTSHTQPFFHDNVGISAWGLAIHQVSRLIAVGSNHREVTVFQPALAVGYDKVTGSRYFQERTGSTWPGRSFPTGTSRYTPVWKLDFGSDALWEFERKDCRLRLPLGPSGSNVPSIDFISDGKGEASGVMATDVYGKLWSLTLARRETTEWPEIHKLPHSIPDFEDEPRGWGVLCIPTSYFMLVRTPQEALGIEQLDLALQLKTESCMSCLQSLDISSSIESDRHSSLSHPSSPQHTKLLEPPVYGLELECGPSIHSAQTTHAQSDVRSYVLGLLLDYQNNGMMVRQPSNIPGFQGNDWVERMTDVLRSDESISLPVLVWANGTYDRFKHKWEGGRSFFDAIKAFKFLLHLPIALRYRINSWAGLHQAMEDIDHSKMGLLETTRLSHIQRVSLWRRSRGIPRLQEGQMAVIRTSAQDIELIPPNPNMISTVCRNFLLQESHDNLQDIPDAFERLNMFAVIPELSLLVVASQKGRVGLFTLTTLEDDFSDVGPVLMLRFERILPPSKHEEEFRPNVPLLGMAVGPLQGKGEDGGMQRKIWRLIMHYMDHTVLSYELKREEGPDGLVIL